MSEEGGIWRTVGGRRIFIKDGENLSTAMKNSGKFKNIQDIENKYNNAEEKWANAKTHEEKTKWNEEATKLGQELDKAREENALERSLNALKEIDDLSEEASHYTNSSEKTLHKKGEEIGSKEFRQYVEGLKKESYNNRNNYKVGDTVDYDANKRGVSPRYGQGKILEVEKGTATHGDTSPDNVYKIQDIKSNNVFKLDAFLINKKIR